MYIYIYIYICICIYSNVYINIRLARPTTWTTPAGPGSRRPQGREYHSTLYYGLPCCCYYHYHYCYYHYCVVIVINIICIITIYIYICIHTYARPVHILRILKLLGSSKLLGKGFTGESKKMPSLDKHDNICSGIIDGKTVSCDLLMWVLHFVYNLGTAETLDMRDEGETSGFLKKRKVSPLLHVSGLKRDSSCTCLLAEHTRTPHTVIVHTKIPQPKIL